MVMDNIDRIMKEADRLGFGVSYGKYRAAHPNGSGDVIPAASKPKSPEKPTGNCVFCGNPFVKSHANQVYCGDECRYEASKIRLADGRMKKAGRPLVVSCIICGADFKPRNIRSKCCSPKCSEENKRNLSHRWWTSRKKGAADGISL